MSRIRWWCGAAIIGVVALNGCASNPPAPATKVSVVADYPSPEIPAAVSASPYVRDQQLAAWKRLQGGDAKGAAKVFAELLKQNPRFYPAEAGLGLAQLASRQFTNANARFSAVLAVNDRYLPAWVGQAEALLGLGRDADAIMAMERVLALDPRREAVRTRLELVRFRLTQSLIESSRKAKSAGRLDDAEKQLEQALVLSPQSTMILHELTLVETAEKHLDEAEAHARKATEVEPREAEWQAALGVVLEQREKFRDAAAAYARAVAIDPRPEWRVRSADLREKAAIAALPADFARLPSADTVTRAQVATFVGIRLDTLIENAPRRVTEVAIDVRTHWAAPWILPVTRAGVMSIFPNHTFQPEGTMRRSDLASVVASLVRLAGSGRAADLSRWQAARPKFSDLPPTHVSYPAVALAVSAGAMKIDDAARFLPTRPASGADLDVAVRRIAQLASQ